MLWRSAPARPCYRHRFLVVFTMNLMARCLPLLSTLLLLPPRAWPKHPLARFVVSASTSPLVFTLALCVFDLLAKVGTRFCCTAPQQL